MAEATAPRWRRDFPFTSEGEEEVTRREFARYLVLASAAYAAGSLGVAVWTSLRPVNRGAPRAIVASAAVREGTAFLFRYPTQRDPAILVRLPGGVLRAFSQHCTHLGCVVYWSAERERMLCPCHDGAFDARTGAVLAGPPQRPLGRIDVEVRADGMVWALGQEAS
jgi:Rieske Fe-S protein